MRISDDERREVAARLRELPSDTCAALKENYCPKCGARILEVSE